MMLGASHKLRKAKVETGRSATIDVLRAMAVGLVVLGHALIFCRHLNGLMEAIAIFCFLRLMCLENERVDFKKGW